jgi:hypothetical protein
MGKQEEYKEKVEKFIELYNDRPNDEEGKPISNAEIARRCGWASNRAHKTASELLKKPEVLSKIRKVEEEQRVATVIGEESVTAILEAGLPEMLRKLKSDPAKFVQAYKNLKSLEMKEENNYDGYSIEELLSELGELVEEASELKRRIKDEIREEEM